MAEGIATPDGKPLDLEAGNRDFARAMSAPPPDDLPAPPKRSTTIESEATAATAGSKAVDAESKATRAKPRVKSAPKLKASYTEDAQSVVTSVWTVTAAIPPTQAFAFVVNTNADQLVSALAEGARHNEAIRNALTGGGEHAWKAQLAIVGLSMAMQSMQIMRDPELRAKAAEHTRAQIASIAKEATPDASDVDE